MGNTAENQRYYQKNKERYATKRKEQRDRNRKFIKDYKSELECIVCGESESVCLDFHHRDPQMKEIEVAEAVRQLWSVARILEEIEKCDILCSNCHRKLHAGLIEL
jgi:ribosomal protein L44E